MSRWHRWQSQSRQKRYPIHPARRSTNLVASEGTVNTPTPLLDRIEHKYRTKPKVVELRRTPEWIRRMNAGQLPAKDQTAHIHRSGGDAA